MGIMRLLRSGTEQHGVHARSTQPVDNYLENPVLVDNYLEFPVLLVLYLSVWAWFVYGELMQVVCNACVALCPRS